MTTIFKHFRNGLRRGAALLALALATAATAQTILVTPGSLANYTYIPPGSGSGSGSGGGTGENVSTLQRCLWAPTTPDETRTVADGFYDFNKEVTVYYRIAGGNGGATAIGGGGGASAIVKNGAVVALGKGGDGGQSAAEVTGTFTIKKGDVLRFVTGGGGGDGVSSGSIHVGGGGGAGYTGGGGGASLAGRGLSALDLTTSAGKGGGTSPGQGGYISGGNSGTAGIGQSGGVSTWSDGSSAPIGSYYYGTYTNQYYDNRGGRAVKFPATSTRSGSPTGNLLNAGNGSNSVGDGYFSGGGGKPGWGGGRWAIIGAYGGCRATLTSNDTSVTIDDNTPCYTFYNVYVYRRETMSRYPAHTGDMQLTRTKTPYYQNGNEVYGGSLPGQIITMYQAPVCGLLQ